LWDSIPQPRPIMPRARVRRVPQRTARPQRMRGVKSPTHYRTPQSTRTIRGMGMGVGMEVAPYICSWAGSKQR
jgi:hypothetical protein